MVNDEVYEDEGVTEEESERKDFLVRALIFFSILVAILMFFLAALIFAYLVAVFNHWIEDSTSRGEFILPGITAPADAHPWFTWAGLIEVLSKCAGIFTLIGAGLAAWAALTISNARAKEAEADQFRDYMKWSLEHIDLESDDFRVGLQSNFALMLLERYAKGDSKLLSEKDIEMADAILAEIRDSSDSFNNEANTQN